MTVCEILDLIRLPTTHGHNADLATAHLIDNLHLLHTRSKQLGPNHVDGSNRMGRQWGESEASLQLEAVEQGHQRVVAEWTAGTYCGDLAEYGDCALEADAIIEAAAKKAYEAARA